MKLAYVVTEPGCMDPTTGAYQHISMGQRELSKHFDVISFVPSVANCRPQKRRSQRQRKSRISALKQTGLWGIFRDVKDFALQSRHGWLLAKEIEKSGCKAAYIRVQALQPLEFFLQRKGIQVFLEANGIQFESRSRYHASWISPIWRKFEHLLYTRANHVFFVGSYGQYWQLASDNWTEVENGVEAEMIQRRHKPRVDSKTIRIVLLARLVAHHRGTILTEALKSLQPDTRATLELHLVGTGFDQLRRELDELLPVIDHGFLARDQIGSVLRQMDIGIITDGPPFASQMKLLDYAAAGCLVVAPNLPHLLGFYQDSGVQFFDRESPESLRHRIEQLVTTSHNINSLARQLHKHVRERYTWETIFKTKAETIKRTMAGVSAQ